MCSIAGFLVPGIRLEEEKERWSAVLRKMNQTQKHRGPDEEGIYLSEGCGLAHTRLSILDLERGRQPMRAWKEGREYCIAYNGETYNMPALRRELKEQGVVFETTSDTEVVLKGYIEEGSAFFTKMNGIFAFAIWEKEKQQLLLVRDRLGVKPLFYANWNGMFLFASELKGILCVPGFSAEVDREGLCEIFALGPAKTPGKGVFRGIHELPAGGMLIHSPAGEWQEKYWVLEAKPHEETMEQTIAHTSWLLEDAVRSQMLSDIPISTFLSGGVDSSLVTSICAQELKKQGKQLNTFSFDFTENNKYFQENAFQPSEDRPYAELMAKYCDTNHTFLECSKEALVEELYPAVRARDLPGMADVEASMLYFCRQVVTKNKVTLTGECADEIFGGYPWFHRKEMLEKEGFPWSNEFSMRTAMLKDEVLSELHLTEYEAEEYEKSLSTSPFLPECKCEERKRQQ
ncbi:MAG: asparagine synthase (glutamine-hydrolyzing), partial [Lachnospiraceae bacterium]|nr:asparagine synthase (glutamine-hydrolyzing) [Lachnospiraceae bacterium]